MLASILASGLAAGAIYALVGVTYNTMFSTSRVMSFTAGQLAMLGGVFGSMFTLKMGMPIFAGFLLTLLGCAIIGIITEFVAVRPVLKSLDQHLYVLSTLALALMIQQVAAIKWGTEPQPFPRLVGWGSGVFDEKFWLPVVACAITIIGLEYLYRRTLVGRAFLGPKVEPEQPYVFGFRGRMDERYDLQRSVTDGRAMRQVTGPVGRTPGSRG
jgi:branched-chain amino acid transport system permease protein